MKGGLFIRAIKLVYLTKNETLRNGYACRKGGNAASYEKKKTDEVYRCVHGV